VFDEGVDIRNATINLRFTNRGQGNIKIGYTQLAYNHYYGATINTATRNRQLYPFYDSVKFLNYLMIVMIIKFITY
jgi:hypothetical protein